MDHAIIGTGSPMIISLVAATCLAATPVKATPLKLASMGFAGLNMDENAARYYSDHFAQQLSLNGFQVTTASEMTALLGLERQKQLMGCSESAASCIAELANALGVDGVITGNLGRFGSTYQVNLKILSSLDGHPLAVFSSRVKGEEQLLEEYERAARQVYEALRGRMGTGVPQADSSSPTEVESTQPSTGRRWAWVPAAAGVAVAGAGGICLWQANVRLQALQSADKSVPLATAQGYRNEGTALQVAGFTAVGLGAAAVVAGAIFYFTGREIPVNAGAVVAPGQASFAVGGAF
jgi:hypothetical protein